MLRLALLLVLFTSVSGCAGYKARIAPASDVGYGYSEQFLSADNYLIRYDGKAHSEYSELRLGLVRRASELCAGSFEITEYTESFSLIIHSQKALWPWVQARLRCGEGVQDRTVPGIGRRRSGPVRR